jgi:hypothetical protein
MKWIIIHLTMLGLVPLTAPAPAQEATVLRQPKDQSKETPAADRSSIASQGRQHPSYQVFAHRATLPPVTVLAKETLAVGEAVKIEVSKPIRVSSQDKQALADLLGVPVGVVQRVLEAASSQAGWDAEQLRQRLCTAAIDYKYLQDRWGRYHPPAEKEKLKGDALMALQAGEINRVWEMFQALPRPQPVGGLHVADP